MHENFCVTNIVLCKVCKEPIMKSEYDDHILEHEEEKKILEEKKNEEKINHSKNPNLESK